MHAGIDLAAIVRRLGGDLYDAGRRALVPGPGHGAADRSLSLRLSGGRLLAHSFAGDPWRDVREHLYGKGVAAPAQARPAGDSETGPSRPERLAAARALWDTAKPVAGTPAETHAQRRAVWRPLPPALRFHPAVPSAVYAGAGRRRPAMLAAIHDPSGRLAGVEVTYLTAGGEVAEGVRRKTVGGRPRGAAVRLDSAARTMLVAEGVFSALSASEAFGLPAWALLAVENLKVWTPPPQARRVVIAADRGAAGEAGALSLRARFIRLGLTAEICWPPAPQGDWNERAQAAAEGARALSDRLAGP